MKRFLLILAAGTFFGTGALAGGPAAIVEEVNAAGAGIEMMEYVDAGRVVELGARGTLVLGYLRSCLNERITGGSVTVGKERSVIKGGRVVRERVECDGGRLRLTLEQAGKSAVVVFRKAPGAAGTAAAFKIYGVSPVVLSGKGVREVVIERLDRPEEVLRLKASRGYVDLSARGKALKRRGLYRARAGGREVVFRVDAYARTGAGPVIGRLVSF